MFILFICVKVTKCYAATLIILASSNIPLDPSASVRKKPNSRPTRLSASLRLAKKNLSLPSGRGFSLYFVRKPDNRGMEDGSVKRCVK